MVKVITYGTYDLLHYGHIKLLERAKALGDYLIVGVTADDFDKTRGKINVQQSLMERIEAVRPCSRNGYGDFYFSCTAMLIPYLILISSCYSSYN